MLCFISFSSFSVFIDNVLDDDHGDEPIGAVVLRSSLRKAANEVPAATATASWDMDADDSELHGSSDVVAVHLDAHIGDSLGNMDDMEVFTEQPVALLATAASSAKAVGVTSNSILLDAQRLLRETFGSEFNSSAQIFTLFVYQLHCANTVCGILFLQELLPMLQLLRKPLLRFRKRSPCHP